MAAAANTVDVTSYTSEQLLSTKRDLEQRLAHFDAGKAKCYHDRDRERLLAVVEATFGTVAPFNSKVRKLLSAQRRASRSSSFASGSRLPLL